MSLDLKDQYDRILRYCFHKVHNRDTAEDITQETFLRFLEHPQYHNIGKDLQYLYTIAGNLCAGKLSGIHTNQWIIIKKMLFLPK